MEYDNNSKIELIINACHKLADVLKDPTEGGTKELTAEARNAMREDAHESLLICIDVLAASAEFNHGFFDVLNIASKYKIDDSQK